MKTKRLSSFLLALLLVVSLCVPAMAVDTPSALTLSVDNAEPVIGDTITVTVSSDIEVTGVQSFGLDLYLDNAAYKLKDYVIYGEMNEVLCVVTDNIVNHSSVNFSGFDTTGGRLGLEVPKGAVVAFTFEVVGASTEPFRLKDVAAYVPGEPDNNLLAETSAELQVTAKDENADPGIEGIFEVHAGGLNCNFTDRISTYGNVHVIVPRGEDVTFVYPEAKESVSFKHPQQGTELSYTKSADGKSFTFAAADLISSITTLPKDYLLSSHQITPFNSASDIIWLHVIDGNNGENNSYNMIVELIPEGSDCPGEELPVFEGATVDISEMEKVSDWEYYCAIPAGQDLKVKIPHTGAPEMVLNANGNKAMEYTYTPGELIITAAELQEAYLPEGNDYRVEIVEPVVDLKEGSEVVFFYINAYEPEYYSYNIIVEILAEESDEPDVPAFDGITVDLNDLTKISRYNEYYFSIPEGENLKVILTDGQNVQQVGEIVTNAELAFTSDKGGEFVLTADELSKYYITDEEYLGYLFEDYGDYIQDENNKFLWLMPFNSNTYTLIIEVVPAEPDEPVFEGTTIPVTGGHLSQYIANVLVSGVDVVGYKSELGYGHLQEDITVYVSPETKNGEANVAFDVVKTDGISGDMSETSVQLENGYGDLQRAYILSVPTVSGGSVLALNIHFEHAICEEHEWQDVTCDQPKTCLVCGRTEGSGLGHNYVCDVCEKCGDTKDLPDSHDYVCGVCVTCEKVSEDNLGHNYVNGACSICHAVMPLPFAATVDGVSVEVSRTGTTTCPYYGEVTELKVTVPADAQSITLTVTDNDITVWDVYAGEDDILSYYKDNPAVMDLTKGYEFMCVNCGSGYGIYHLYIEVEQTADPAYTVEMPADKTAVAGETVEIPVVIGHTTDVEVYNAFDMSFEYDASVLQLISTEIEGMTVETGDGTVRVQRYGDDLAVGSEAFKLTFKVIATGDAEVKLVSAKVDMAENAEDKDAPEATLLDDATAVTAAGYAVTLPEGFEGEAIALPGEDYTFEALDKNYDYTFGGSTMGGEAATVIDNVDGTFTVADVDGVIIIKAEKTGKKFGVTLGEDLSGEAQAQYMTDYTATLTKEAGYGYAITVTIGGDEYTGFTYDEETGVVTIPGGAITGAVVIDSGKTAGEFTVTFEGNGAGDAKGEAVAEGGSAYSFKLNKAAGYEYEVSATMGGKEVELTESEGTYTIEKVTGDIVVTIAKTSDLAVEVGTYVELDGKTVFIVTATQTLADGKALAYEGKVMFYSEQYKAWAYLVVVGEGQTFTADAAKAVITEVTAEYVTLTQNYDVNGTGTVDVNDAQFVYNVYKCEYDNVVDMQKFLNADTNGSKGVDVNDAAAVVNNIN